MGSSKSGDSARIDAGGHVIWSRAIGGVETCHQVPGFDVNFDIGRCPDGAVDQRFLLLTHGHIDHAAGLPYYVSLRSLYGRPPPLIACPAGSEPHLRRVLEAWEPLQTDTDRCELRGVRPGDRVELGKGRFAVAVPAYHRIEAVGWVVCQRAKKLRAAWVGRTDAEIRDAARRGVEVSEVVDRPEVGFTGDTTIETLDDALIRTCRVLLLECTFFGNRVRRRGAKRGGHVHLDALAERATELENENIILVHLSQRHHPDLVLSEARSKLPEEMWSKFRVLMTDGRVTPLGA